MIPPKVDELIDNITIEKDIDFRELYESTMLYNKHKTLPKMIKDDVLNRFLVNGIRHDYTNYESNLRQINRIENGEYYANYKNAVLDTISNEYPALYEECNNQKSFKQMVHLVKKNKHKKCNSKKK